MTHYDELQKARAAIETATGRSEHRLALVLGSGLGDYASALPDAIEMPYERIPGFPVAKVAGHHGSLFSVKMGDSHALVFAGRAHYYEGWSLDKVVFGVRSAILAGCRTVVLTNAAGSVSRDRQPGDLVLLRDHLNLTGHNPLIGTNDDRLGTRFPDMSDVYCPDFRALAKRVGTESGQDLADGVYAWFTGPSFETPAEVRMAAQLGAHLVGMSTVPEAIAARHMGARVLGISLVTNLAAGVSPVALTHEEVAEAGEEARPRVARLLDALLPSLAVRP